MKENGKVEFKTDNRGLFEFALEEAKESEWELETCTFDLHHNEEMMQGNVMTEYEEKFSERGNPIHKMIISRKKRSVEIKPFLFISSEPHPQKIPCRC